MWPSSSGSRSRRSPSTWACCGEWGLVSVTRLGQQRLYRLNPKELRPVNDWVKPYERYWTQQVDRIKERAEEKAIKMRLITKPSANHKGEAMTMTDVEPEIKTLEITREQRIDAPIQIVFETILEEIGPNNTGGQNNPMPMKLEAFPGGRWYRDLGKNAGHLWGHVQVIKPPTLLEICGPMFMSYPGVNHIAYRLKSEGNSTLLTFMHRAFGLIADEHAKGVRQGWGYILERIAKASTSKQ
jgi:hypothetical protein